jgi:anti-sigma regulatory factor (Ser/Thr protein kinase)
MPIGSDEYAPVAARHALGVLREELDDARYHVCQLLVSELVTNVVRHAASSRSLAAADLRVRLDGDRVRVEVRDEGPGFSPRAWSRDHDESSGWGLHLVGALADDWGIEPGVQNCVWFELERAPSADAETVLAHY